MTLPADLPVDNDPAATRALALALAVARLNVRFGRARPTRATAKLCMTERAYTRPRRGTAADRAALAELEASGG